MSQKIIKIQNSNQSQMALDYGQTTFFDIMLYVNALRCPFFSCIRKALIDSIGDIIGPMSDLSDDKLIDLLLHGNSTYSIEDNASILKITIIFLKSSEKFDIPLI